MIETRSEAELLPGITLEAYGIKYLQQPRQTGRSPTGKLGDVQRVYLAQPGNDGPRFFDEMGANLQGIESGSWFLRIAGDAYQAYSA